MDRDSVRHEFVAGSYAAAAKAPQASSCLPVQTALQQYGSEPSFAGGVSRFQAFAAGSYACASAPEPTRRPRTINCLPVQTVAAGSVPDGAEGILSQVPATLVAAATAVGTMTSETRRAKILTRRDIGSSVHRGSLAQRVSTKTRRSTMDAR